MMLGLPEKKVQIVPYDLAWLKLFEAEKELLLNTFGDKILAIEHVGSTAVPGLSAKPIIDIIVAVKSLDEADLKEFREKLPPLGYENIPGRKYAHSQFFPKGSAEGRTHHVALTTLDSEWGWQNKILFRDYLRNHEKARNEYESLKHALATLHADNRDEYTEKKGEFVKRILIEAKNAE